MTIWQAIKSGYRESWPFMMAFPMLVAIPVFFEALQHVVEMQIGMYDSPEMAEETEKHPMRMAFAMLKVIALTIPIYWVTRFIAFDRDRATVLSADGKAIKLFTVYFLFMMAFAVVQLFLIPATTGWLIGGFIIGQIIGCSLVAWGVAAPLGNAEIGPVRSVRLMWRHIPATFVIAFIGILPLMIPHYALGIGAIFVPQESLKWLLLALDSLLVGWLAIALIGVSYHAALRAAAAQGVNLLPAK